MVDETVYIVVDVGLGGKGKLARMNNLTFFIPNNLNNSANFNW